MIPFFVYTGIILALPFLFSSSKTTVILLDNNRSSNGVFVVTQGGTINLEQPYTQTVMSTPDAKPQAPSEVEEAVVGEKYAQTLEALPPAPISVFFYFEEDSARLTPESKAKSASVVALIKSREPCIVDIVGHTDTQNSSKYNYALGSKRAKMVKSFLQERKVQMKKVSVASHGEADLLIPTADEVDEPRNRRVEVIVR